MGPLAVKQTPRLIIRKEPHTNVLGRIIYIQEFLSGEIAQWMCPECGNTNVEHRNRYANIGETIRCICGKTFIRTTGQHDDVLEIIRPEIAEQIIRHTKEQR